MLGSLKKKLFLNKLRFKHKSTKIELHSNYDQRGTNKITLFFEKPFTFQLGGSLPQLDITWKEFGNPEGPIVYVIPAFSANSHITPHPLDESPGWWQDIVGPEKAINTDKMRVICSNILGSPYGTSSPLSIDPTTGTRYARNFPQITPRDQAVVHKLLLQYLGVHEVEAVIGSSLGGMQALHLAAIAPKLAKKLLLISTSAKTKPATVAIRYAQRQAIAMDPQFHNGDYHLFNTFPEKGMKVARTIGLISYLTRVSYNTKFNWHSSGKHHYTENSFEVESWLSYNSEKFTKQYDANCYLVMSKCMDLMDIHWDEEQTQGVYDWNPFQNFGAETLVIGVKEDTLTPLEEQKYIYDSLKALGKTAQFHVLSSPSGHDAFLKDKEFFGGKIKQFLSQENMAEISL